MKQPDHNYDFLVIGSGIAGLSFAIKVSPYGRVAIVTKKQDSDSNTNYAQGGIASVLDPNDSFDNHIQDTLKAGAGLCDRRAVEILVREAPERIRELIKWGTSFTVKKTNAGRELELGREGGHSHNRIVHAKDLTGAEIERALLHRISKIKNITIFENHTAVDLLTEHQMRISRTARFMRGTKRIRCYGAYILDNKTGAVHLFKAAITLLATGGVGQVYLHTTNPSIATGDGIAMAHRAGAEITDMEFIQFHPTVLYIPEQTGRSFLISEAVRGEGGILLNSRGERFMEKVHPLVDLAPRDVVSRTIDSELKRLGDHFVYLNISHRGKRFLKHRFPNIYERCLEKGIDISRDPIPVVPAHHFLCGGIISDIDGRTTIEDLYVSGESSATGVHGANRLASNSLLEGVVYSHRAALHAIRRLHDINQRNAHAPEFPQWDKQGTFDLQEWILVQHNIDDVKRLMWDYVGIVRSDQRLRQAARRMQIIAEEVYNYYKKSTITAGLLDLRNMVTVAQLIITAALARKDSVGLHYNIDHPQVGKKLQHIVLHNGRRPRSITIDER